MAEQHGASFMEVSSKTKQNVKELFVDAVEKIVDNTDIMDPNFSSTTKDGVVNIMQNQWNQPSTGGCLC